MYIFSSYRIHFIEENEANQECADWLSAELKEDVSVGEGTEIAEDSTHMCVEDVWDWLEPFVASRPEASFELVGFIDASQASGEFEDFRFEIDGGSITAYRSGWYEETAKDTYEDYADFCEYYENADGTPICTEEEFNAFEGEFIRLVGMETVRMLDEVPLDGPITDRGDLSNRGLR